jgi:hypothetical protein
MVAGVSGKAREVEGHNTVARVFQVDQTVL